MIYSAIKEALQQWWDYELGVQKEKSLQEFILAKGKPGKSINMFTLRLELFENRTYPGVCMQAHDNPLRAFLHKLIAVFEQCMHEYILNH